LGRDRESRRHRHAELRHLREADALAPEQRPPAVRGLVEVVDVTHGAPSFTQRRGLLLGVLANDDLVNLRGLIGLDFVWAKVVLLAWLASYFVTSKGALHSDARPHRHRSRGRLASRPRTRR